MVGRSWSEEEKAEASRKAKERYAAKSVAVLDRDDEEPPAPRTRKLRRLDIPSRARSGRAIRGVKLMVPECVVIDDHGQPVSGPCKFRTDDWWETCTHGGPSQSELDALGYTGPPAYYEASWETFEEQAWEKVADGTLMATGAPRKQRRRIVKPRIVQVSGSERNASGLGPLIALDWGGKLPEHFGIAPFCEYWDCYEQNIQRYWKGSFCSDNHAILVYADETGEFLPLGHRQTGQKLRRKAMDALRPNTVRVGA